MPTKTTEGTSGNRSMLLWLLLAIAVGALIWSFLNYWTTSRKLAVLTDPKLASELNQKETDELLEKMRALMIIPKDKNPIVATINDVETLATNQDFYRNAHNGDRLVIFTASKKAVIYDADDNRIVNVGPIFYTNPETEKSAVNSAERLAIEVRNGTSNTGAGTRVRDQLKANASFDVVGLGKAAKNDYTTTIIVDTTDGSKTELITALQRALGGATIIKAVPQGEAAPRSEILVIVGAK